MDNGKRLIDANALMVDVQMDDAIYANLGGIGDVRFLVDSQPTVSAVEVVHGHWISKGYKIECSVCEHRAFLGTKDPVIHEEEKNIRKYCHNCGAKMDGERKDNA